MNSSTTLRQDEIAIRELLNEVIVAFNNADLEKLLELHTDDIILMEPHMPIIQGKRQVRELFAGFQRKKIEMELRFELLELEVVADRAFVRGSVMKSVLQNGENVGEDTGKFICLLKKQEDGGWLRTHVIVNSDQPVVSLLETAA